jgi:hypothetical protein
VADRQQRQQSPVEAINKIREELGDFRRTSSSDARLVEAYRAEARAALRRILLEPSVTSLSDGGSNSDGFSVIDHLRERGVIHTWSKQQLARHRRALLSQSREASPSNSNSNSNQSADPAEIQPPTSEQA